MTTDNIISMSCDGNRRSELLEKKPGACSGKCGGGCYSEQKLWIIAASKGVISIFSKGGEGEVSPINVNDGDTFQSIEQFSNFLKHSLINKQFDKLAIIGNQVDISWVQAALPKEAARKITAEIEYPIVADWLKDRKQNKNLVTALNHMFKV